MHSEKNVMNLKVKKPFYVTTVATALSNTYQVVRWPQTVNHPKRKHEEVDVTQDDEKRSREEEAITIHDVRIMR